MLSLVEKAASIRDAFPNCHNEKEESREFVFVDENKKLKGLITLKRIWHVSWSVEIKIFCILVITQFVERFKCRAYSIELSGRDFLALLSLQKL